MPKTTPSLRQIKHFLLTLTFIISLRSDTHSSVVCPTSLFILITYIPSSHNIISSSPSYLGYCLTRDNNQDNPVSLLKLKSTVEIFALNDACHSESLKHHGYFLEIFIVNAYIRICSMVVKKSSTDKSHYNNFK